MGVTEILLALLLYEPPFTPDAVAGVEPWVVVGIRKELDWPAGRTAFGVDERTLVVGINVRVAEEFQKLCSG